jgi:prepilin-type N-terminal cleavage/methylation domain-containing protein
MKNERGITLVELLAVLAIGGIILTLLTSVFISGKKASDRGVTNQMLQQEANYILENIRKEYLKLEGDDIKLEIIDNTLKMNEKVISQGYSYDFIIDNAEDEIVYPIIIKRNEPYPLKLTITKANLHYTVNTTLSKLQ